MQHALFISEPTRRRRIYVAHWILTIGAELADGVVRARSATARGRQIFVTVSPCGTTRHLSPQK